MAEFPDCQDQSPESQNAVSPSQVAKRSDIRLGLIFPSDSIRGRNSSFNHSQPLRQPYLYNSQYHTPLIEESSNLVEANPCIESERPGTPALTEHGDLIIEDIPHPSSFRSTLDGRRYVDAPRYQPRYNHPFERSFSGGVSRDPGLPYPPTAAPPSSPSQLYAFLLQRHARPECPIPRDPRPQAFIPSHIEWNSPNIIQARNQHRNDYGFDRQDIWDREQTLYRYYNNTHHRYEHLGHVERRPFLNQNYIRLPYNMVRIKNTNDDHEANSMNGFAEDNEGNHECHDLRHDSVPPVSENPVSSAEAHLNGTHQINSELPGSSGIPPLSTIYQGEWPMHHALWMSGPSSIGEKDPLDGFGGDDTESIMSFSSTTASMSSRRPHTHQLGTKVEMVYSLLSMLGSCNKEDMSRTLLEMSNNQDSCIAMRQSGCLPLLIQLLHGNERDQVLSEQRSSENVKYAVREARRRASQALHNIVHAHPDDRRGRREARVLRLLEQIRDYSDFLRDLDSSNVDFTQNENLDLHPGPAIAALMKLSFDEEHRHAMCQLGGLQAIAELIQADYEVHGNTSDQFCVTIRRYAGMALTNLTFGDGTNKALLCSMKPFMQALVAQLQSPSEDLRQVTASVLRNLSWRADASSKQILREVGVVTNLMKAAMEAKKESTLKSILSALWNLSAHCSMNKADICEIDGALEFLVSTLTYKSASNTLSIIENGGGILRNVSSHIAVREDYRAVLRKQKCLQTLLSHLKSPSLTIVSNACGTLWNLSARCAEDQRALWEMGAVGMLRNLVHSKHKMISMGSSAALKNLLAAKPEGMGLSLSSHSENGHHLNGGLSNMPSLLVRKQKALAADIDENLSETCDNIDSPKTSPTPQNDLAKKFVYDTNGLNCLEQTPQYLSYLPGRMYHSINGQVGSPVRVPRSESKDSLGSTRSEPPHYKAQRERFKIFINNNRTSTLDSRTVQEKPTEWKEKTNLPYEDNSNVVLQLFRHLQNGIPSGGTSESKNHLNQNDHEDAPAVRPTSLLSPKRGVWNIRNGRAHDRIMLNGLHSAHTGNGLKQSKLGECDLKAEGLSNTTDNNNILDIPGNRRINDKLLSEEHMTNGTLSHESKHNGFIPYESAAKSSDKENVIKSNVLFRKKKTSDVSSLSEIVNRDTASDEISLDQNQLGTSRCSSLSSLTSCFQHSARSSWVSDVSQRTSAVISPSDIPDSPGYCTSEERPHIYEFTDKVPDADMHGLIRPRPAWPSNSAPSGDFASNSVKELSLENNILNNSHLRSFTVDHSEVNEIDSPSSLKVPPARPQNSPASPEKELCSSNETSSSLENNEQEIEHRIKNNLVASHTDEISTNSIHSNQFNPSLSKITNLCGSFSHIKSGIPIKSNVLFRLTQSFPPPQPDLNSISQKYVQSDAVNSTRSNAVCDDNDNLVCSYESGANSNKEQSSQIGTSKKNIAQAFESKCLSVCKKYPALSQKSSFRHSEQGQNDERFQQDFSKMHLSSGGKSKTSIPQLVRATCSGFDNEQHPKQLHIKSQNLPVYKGAALISVSKQTDDSKPAAENTSSAEENASEGISSSLSACDESEDNDSDGERQKVTAQSGDFQARGTKVKSRKSKANRRSMEIRPPSEESSEDDNKNVLNNSSASAACAFISVTSSGSEEKVKQDTRTKEKVSRGTIPDLLEGAAYYNGSDSRKTQNFITINSSNMTESMELRRGAMMIAAELEEGIDDCTHSSTSFDLENMKPPSCMGEMSMTSSGLSDLLSNGNGYYINGKRAIDRRRSNKRSKKLNGTQRFVLKSVRQTLANNLDASKEKDNSEKPVSASTSFENISMKSSGTSDLIENINPPSMLDDISMTNSCASLNSISSDILESRSQSLADPRSNSEMFQRLNAAAAMVQVYSRELNNIMTGSMKSSCNSDCLDLVKPPSIFQDIAEVTVEDGTEVASDPLVSDFELEEELPHDDEASVPSTDTIHSPFLQSLRKEDGSTENLNSSFDGDSLDKDHQIKRISSLAFEPQASSLINMDHNSIQHSFGDGESKLADINETGVNVVNNIQSTSTQPIRRGPRIVKPINRETVRQMQEKKNAEKSVKPVRGRIPANKPRNLFQQVTCAQISKSTIAKSSPLVTGVRPTRTSALRASQSKQTNKTNGDRVSPRSFLSKPPISSRTSKVTKTVAVRPSTSGNTCTDNSVVKRPNPPVKQGTFTKDDKVPHSLPVANNTDLLSEQNLHSGDDQNNNEKICNNLTSSSAPSDSKLCDKKLFPLSSSSHSNLQRKLSAPLQRKSAERPGLPLSPSSHSIVPENRNGKKIPEKQSPSGICGRSFYSANNRTASTNSLSSVSSNSFSAKKSNSPKDVPSKISSIWKKSESSSSANSPVTDTSNADKNVLGKVLPVNNSLRSDSVTPPSSLSKNIPRSSTYEKLSKVNGNLNQSSKVQQKPITNSETSVKNKSLTAASKNINKTKAQATAPKRGGGARIVKPVTPRTAITSKSLRQSGFHSYSSTQSYSLSSGPSACISIERNPRNYHDSNVSIPLVTAPFAYGSNEINAAHVSESKIENNTNGREDGSQCANLTSSVLNNESESEESDK